MRYSILAFAAGAAAAPFAATGGAALCPTGLFSNPQCCATDVLNVAGLNCAVPNPLPGNTNDFISGCAAVGQQAKCCVVPVANQAVLCQDVSPSAGGGAPSAPPAGPTVTATATGGGPGGPPTPTGGASTSSCASSSAAVTTATPSAPAPTPSAPAPTSSAPAATSTCGCDD